MELFWANEGDGIVDPTPELVTSQASQKRSLLYIGPLLYYGCLYSCSLQSVFSVGGSGILPVTVSVGIIAGGTNFRSTTRRCEGISLGRLPCSKCVHFSFPV